jgi:hypothetical protein
MTSAERRAYNQRFYRWTRYEAALARAGNPQPWIYVIGCDEVRLVKIGVSSNLQSRLATMQTGSPVVLRVLWKMPGSIDVEQDLHACFRVYRKHGEWFDFGDENPVAMVAGAAALLGYWRPSGLAEVPPRIFSPETSSELSPTTDDEEIPRIIMPDWPLSEASGKPIEPPPMPPLPPLPSDPQSAEETP